MFPEISATFGSEEEYEKAPLLLEDGSVMVMGELPYKAGKMEKLVMVGDGGGGGT